MIPERMLNQKCYIARRTEGDEYTIVGEESHGAPIETKCRIDYNVKLTFNQSGTQVPSIAKVFVNTDITDHDWVYLDTKEVEVVATSINMFNITPYNTNGVNDGTTPTPTITTYIHGRKPLQVNHLYDGYGNFHHCEVYL